MEKSKSLKSNQLKTGTVINLQQGKLPPQALDLEEAVIGAMSLFNINYNHEVIKNLKIHKSNYFDIELLCIYWH